MMGEMGIDWGLAVSSWAVFVPGGGAADWADYPGMKREYLQLDARARRRNERQFRRRRHAGHHGGIRWATLVAAYRKMEPVRRWAVEGYTR